jgi:hypothetical protein
LEVVIAFSWCCTGAARRLRVAEYIVEGKILESGKGETKEIA